MLAVIAGGGIGGLSAGVALRRSGLDVLVLEQTRDLQPAGAGLMLAPNGMAGLARLGLDGEARASGAVINRAVARSWKGARLFDLDIAEIARGAEGPAHPAVAIRRSDLQRILLNELGLKNVRLGKRCTGYANNSDGTINVRVEGGEDLRADLLVGADGLRSAVRAQLLEDGPPRYAGYTSWRGIATPPEGTVPPGAATVTLGRGSEVGVIPVGDSRAYWFATANVREGAGEPEEGARSLLLRAFAEWPSPVLEAFEATPEEDILRADIYDRDPWPWWGEGAMTLLGDAAHPMTPNLGQGACQAIEDAVELGGRLRIGGDVHVALRAYESRRIDRTAWVVKQSRRVGRLNQFEHPVACALRDLALRLAPSSWLARSYHRLWQWPEAE